MAKTNERIFCAVDNGCTGTIGAVDESGDALIFMRVPTYKSQDYNKSKVKITTHVDYETLKSILWALKKLGTLHLVTERPLKNPRLFNATVSGIRAHEILLAVTRSMGLEITDTMDSRDWQKAMCGEFRIGESKQASLKAGLEMFPNHSNMIRKHGDADGLLMAEFSRRRTLAEEETRAKETRKK